MIGRPLTGGLPEPGARRGRRLAVRRNDHAGRDDCTECDHHAQRGGQPSGPRRRTAPDGRAIAGSWWRDTTGESTI